jgi:hypothetical protein
MAGKLSPRAQLKLNELRELELKVIRVYGLVEQFAGTKSNPDQLATLTKRGFADLKRSFMGAGMDAMGQLAAGMEIAAGRGASQTSKARILREGIGSLKFQIELEQRAVVAEDEARQRAASATET